jgi:hypothetical protein
MPVPVETHCEKDFTRCKSRYFDVLVSNLASAEGDATKENDAQEKYELEGEDEGFLRCRLFAEE